MWPNPQETADLVAFTDKILGKLHFLCSVKIPNHFENTNNVWISTRTYVNCDGVFTSLSVLPTINMSVTVPNTLLFTTVLKIGAPGIYL